jgi:hypothetical protein
MEKTISTLAVATFIVISTAAFGYVQYASTGLSPFPYFHLGCLMIGGLLMISIKRKFSRLYLTEAVGAFALYTVMISLFTVPVIDVVAWLMNE